MGAVGSEAEVDVDAVLAVYREHVNPGWARVAGSLGTGVETRAEGPFVFDQSGEPYLDCGGYGVTLLGHAHPRVVEAVCEQIRRQPMPSRLLLSPPLAAAAEALAAKAPAGLEFVHLTTSGAEAVELALKLARARGYKRIIRSERGFHGKTLGALSVCGIDAYRSPFEPLLDADQIVPFGDTDQMVAAIGSGPPAVVILEAIQGEGGIWPPPPGYLREISHECRKQGAMLVIDEVLTGVGRTGAWWVSEEEQAHPDVIVAGKALGGGVVPIGAVIATPEAYAPLGENPFLHSSTFANSPLAAAAVRATVEVISTEHLVERAARLGASLQSAIRATLSARGAAAEVRGRGLLLGIEWATGNDATLFFSGLLQERVLSNFSYSFPRVVRLTPPATLEDKHVEKLLNAIDAAAAGV